MAMGLVIWHHTVTLSDAFLAVVVVLSVVRLVRGCRGGGWGDGGGDASGWGHHGGQGEHGGFGGGHGGSGQGGH
jgi:hypothetical protein